MSPTDIALFSLIAVLLASNTAIMIHLGQRIDRLGERLAALAERLASLETRTASSFARLEERMDRLQEQLRDHAAAHARIAHGQG